jgi:hypothetical protein
MRRREFITLLGGAAVARPLAFYAQQSEEERSFNRRSSMPDNGLVLAQSRFSARRNEILLKPPYFSAA